MEKLLHERLNDVYESRPTGSCIVKVGDKYIELVSDDALSIAREIERYYIPRPRFEDGEPVKFGSNEIEWEDTDDYALKTPWRMNAISQVGVPMATAGSTIVSRAAMTDGKLVKRPTQKIYDADGVPTKNGDKVYPIKYEVYSDSNGYVVDHVEIDDGVNSPRVYFIDDVGMSWMRASELTHEQPVFDGEGERICKGDTVWNVTTGERIEVTDLNPDIYTSVEGTGTKSNGWYYAENLTHSEPDSQQRINEDAEKLVRQLAEHYEIDDTVWISSSPMSPTLLDSINSLLERQRSLIERGA